MRNGLDRTNWERELERKPRYSRGAGKSRAQTIAMQAKVNELLLRRGEAVLLVVTHLKSYKIKHTLDKVTGLAYAEEID